MPIIHDVVQFFLIFLIILMAFITVELKDMLKASICFCGMSIAVGSLFWLLNAPNVAIFQLLIYAGALVILFVATIMLTKRHEGVS